MPVAPFFFWAAQDVSHKMWAGKSISSKEFLSNVRALRRWGIL
jgi:hypothetical protein